MLRLLSVVLAIAGLAVGAAPQALAHTVLLSADPSPESTVQSGPARVSATFNEELQKDFAAMTVVGPDGNIWSTGDPEIRGGVVSVAMRPTGPAGAYTVNYRVTSNDGHAVSGSWSFTVAVAGTGEPGPAASGAGSDTGDRTPIPLWPLAAGAVALVAGAVLWAARRQA